MEFLVYSFPWKMKHTLLFLAEEPLLIMANPEPESHELISRQNLDTMSGQLAAWGKTPPILAKSTTLSLDCQTNCTFSSVFWLLDFLLDKHMEI